MLQYVYIFFDPTNDNKVFYCGRGTGNRPKHHLTQSGVSTVSQSGEDAMLGASPEDLHRGELDRLPDTPAIGSGLSKIDLITRLTQLNITPRQMIRVIASGLNLDLAKTLESFCIHHVYGKTNLCNIQSGEGSERFRPFGDWDSHAWQAQAGEAAEKSFYVYVLRHPRTGDVKYTGKGKGSRLFAHFRDLDATLPEAERLTKQCALKELQEEGFSDSDIARIIASDLTEEEAFAIESFCIKYVYGSNTNAVLGHHHERFRARDDWELRLGFDIPFLAADNGSAARLAELDQWRGQGFLTRLEEVASAHPEIQFGEMFNHGAGAAALQAVIYGRDGKERGTVYIQSFSAAKFGISMEIRWKGKEQSLCFRNKFRTFERDKWSGVIPTTEDLNYINRRREKVFLPDAWANNPTPDVNVAKRRLGWLVALLQTDSLEELSRVIGDEAVKQLLGVNEELRAVLEGKSAANQRTRQINKLRKFARYRATDEDCEEALMQAGDNLEQAKQLLATCRTIPKRQG